MNDKFKVPTLPVAAKVEDDGENLKIKEPLQEEKASGKELSQQCPYKIPPWSTPPPPEMHYKFEVLKSGRIIDEIEDLQLQAHWKFGRLHDNNIEMAHPTISRFHAVLQYKPESPGAEDDIQKKKAGWYIYDLDSTHGTFLNKQRVPGRVFIRMRVGHMLRLGASTRCYILQGPSEDEEPESELTVTELRAQRQRQEVEAIETAQKKVEEAAAREGISWGMGDDADEETDLTHNPYASTNNEDLFLDDPKRTLRGYFEREDVPLEYKCDEMSAGSFVCRIELPLDDSFGRPIIAEVVHKGRKKECVVQCALEACRILDRHGVLRQSNQEPLKRKTKSQNSDDDDDEFWDRTGDVERKKMRKSQAGTSTTLTYDDLVKQEREHLQQLQQLEAEEAKYMEAQKRLKEQKEQEQDLDSFMETLSDDMGHFDKTEIRKLKLEKQRLKAELQKLHRLIKIAKPVDLSFNPSMEQISKDTIKVGSTKKILPMIGKRNQFSKFKPVKIPSLTTTSKNNVKAFGSDEEEVDEDELEPLKSNIVKDESKIKHTVLDEMPELLESATTESHEIALKQHEPVVCDNTNTEETISCVQNLAPENNDENTCKKRRPRQRQRNKRQEIYELDEHESNEKYAKWVPPENQSGDGYTELNKKFGY